MKNKLEQLQRGTIQVWRGLARRKICNTCVQIALGAGIARDWAKNLSNFDDMQSNWLNVLTMQK